jgi:hypothetical protein
MGSRGAYIKDNVCATRSRTFVELSCGFTSENINAGWRRAQLCGQQAITVKKLGAAISAAGEELQVSGHKMAFVGGHDLR